MALAAATKAHAQRPSDTTDARLRAMLPKTSARALAGIVVDSAMTPIESVTVFITSLRNRTLTRTDGTFRFENVKPGTYHVTARKVGYAPQARDVSVDEHGGAVGLALVPIPYVLAPVVSSSKRGGLSGIVGDTAYNVLPGAEVWLMTGGGKVVTDSTGAFFIDVKPGHYVLRVALPGYAPRLASVTIPADSGRQIVVWLAPTTRVSAAREAAIVDELSERLLRRSPNWSKILTREDILRSGIAELPQLTQMGAGVPVNPSCEALVDGKERMPLWSLDASEIETLEIYVKQAPRAAPTSINNNRRITTQTQPADDCQATVYVWLRR